ncbi:hypothetical protein [Teredinibacter turnerae]|uniref:hypothetical protein n=1 Tax=Teredinibacter turnerae TaxID=2426 RepID=UPI0005F8493B|nr:hypothetical protein [Teredinibacter turnerae]
MFLKNLSFCVLLAVILASCSGSGDGGSGGPEFSGNDTKLFVPGGGWKSLIGKDHDDLTKAQLKDAYWGLAASEFSGSTELAILTPELAVRFAYLIFDYYPYNAPISIYPTGYELSSYMGVAAYDWFEGELDFADEVDVDVSYRCDRSGDESVEAYKGKFIGGEGRLYQQFHDCLVYYDWYVSGESYALIEPYPVDSYDAGKKNASQAVTFFNELVLEQKGSYGGSSIGPISMFGFSDNTDRQESAFVSSMVVLMRESGADGYEALKAIEMSKNSSTYYPNSVAGAIALKGYGSVLVRNFRFEGADDFPLLDPLKRDNLFAFELVGADGVKARITTIGSNQRVLDMDINGDGDYDERIVFNPGGFIAEANPAQPYFLLEFNSEDTPLYSIDQFDMPPDLVTSIKWATNYPPEDGFRILPPIYIDADTPEEEVQVEIVWRQNGEVITEAANNLELSTESYDDPFGVSVEVVISDGVNRIVSNRLTYWY